MKILRSRVFANPSMHIFDDITIERMSKLRRKGVIFFDVDDTLLARRSENAKRDQIYSESAAATLLPKLLHANIRLCIITGHGWNQLQSRLIEPLIADLHARFSFPQDVLESQLFVYANRGATRISFQSDKPVIDPDFCERYLIEPADSQKLYSLFERLLEVYLSNYPELQNASDRPTIIERDRTVLSLRPILKPTNTNAHRNRASRADLQKVGTEWLFEQNLSQKYSLTQSGKSTLELSKLGISKNIAFEDVIGKLAQTDIERKEIEAASIYVGDEFGIDGNDHVILKNHTRTLCFSVSHEENQGSYANVKNISRHYGKSGVAATAALIDDILKSLK